MREIAFKLVTYATLWGGESLLEKQLEAMENSLLGAKKVVNWAHMEKVFSNFVIFYFLKLIPTT